MDERVMILIVMALALSACQAEAAGYPSADSLRTQAEELERQADALDARATSVAQATREALETEIRGIQAALDAQERQIAICATATAVQRQAMVEATAEAQNATATATAEAATATVRAAEQSVALTAQSAQALAVQATASAIERQTQREEATQVLQTFTGWLILFGSLAALVAVAWYLLPVIKARLQVVRRRAGEIEPLVVTLERIILPSRMVWPLLNVNRERMPLLAPPNYQDRASGRAQLLDVVGAARGGERRRLPMVRQSGGKGHQGQEMVPTVTAPDWPTRVPLTGLRPARHR